MHQAMLFEEFTCFLLFPLAFTVHPNEAAKEFPAPRLPAAASAGSAMAFATDLVPVIP